MRQCRKGVIFKTLVISVLISICITAISCKNVSRINSSNSGNESSKEFGYGFIDKQGNFVIKPHFDLAQSFSEGLAAFEIGDKWGYIDLQGNVVIEPQYDGARPFHEGLASVLLKNEGNGYINQNGEWAIEPEKLDQDYIGFGDFHDGLARVGYLYSKSGYIDRTGSLVIPRIYESSEVGGDFSEGVVAVSIEGGRRGYIDTTGNFVPQPTFEGIGDFYEGLAEVRIGDEFGYMDRQWNIVIEPQFKETSPFSDGLANVVALDGKRGFIDKTGEMVIELPDNCNPWYFSEELGVFISGGQDELHKYGYIDKAGNIVIEPQFNYAEPFSDGVALVMGGGDFIDPRY